MKTFAVNNPVIFVTEVIFLGIYCTFFFFFVMRHTHKKKILHLSMNFLVGIKEKLQNKRDRSRVCLRNNQSGHFLKIPSLKSLLNLNSFFVYMVFEHEQKRTHDTLSGGFMYHFFPLKSFVFRCWNACVYSLNISWCQSFTCKPV